MIIYLVEFSASTCASPLQDFGFSSGNGYVPPPVGILTVSWYEPRVLNPGTFERHLWQPERISGGGGTVGTIELANADGALDALFDLQCDGQVVTVSRGDDAAARPSFQTVFTGTIKAFSWTSTTLRIGLHDRAADFAELPMVVPRYGGTNALPAGVDGVEGDLKGRRRPLLLGRAENFAPPKVNTSKLVFELSYKPIAAVLAVWEGGVAITAGSDRSSLATLLSTAPAAATYDWYLGTAGTDGAYIRLGSSPGSNAITVHAQEGATAADRTVAQLLMRGLGLSGLGGFDAVNAAESGYWCGTDDVTKGQVADALCIGVGASLTPDRSGVFVLQRLDDPAGATPVRAIGLTDVLGESFDLRTTADFGGQPPYQIELAYARNWTVQQASALQGSVSEDRKAWLALEYRKVTSIRTAHGGSTAPPVALTTLLLDPAAAQAEADRVRALFNPPAIRRRYYVQAPVSVATADGLDPGDVLLLTLPRFGFDTGRPMVLTGMLENHAAGRVTLYLWG